MTRFSRIFNIDQLGLKLGAQTKEIPGSDGTSRKQLLWTPQIVKKVKDEIAREMPEDPFAEVAHRGSAPLWVMAAAVQAMYPASNTFLPPVEGVFLKVHNLTQGEINPEAGVTFDLTRSGDILYVTYYADDPSKPQLYGGGHHSYNPELIPLIKAPIAGADTHVCLTGNSSYHVTMSIATAYFSGCKSLSIMGGGPGGEDAGYFCCVTSSTDRVLGALTLPLQV